MKRENLSALFHALSGAAGLIASFYTRGQLNIPEEPTKTVGYSFFGLGFLLFAYTAFYLREAFRGNVAPVTDHLIVDGPYRAVRHPLYLAMLIMCIGLALGLRSIWGLAITLCLFFPSGIVRARLEEKALHEKFGEAWEDYANGTDFMIPLLY